MITRWVVLAVIALYGFSCSNVAWGMRMPRGSFLSKPVTSSAQLATMVRKDPKVAARYAAHFGVPVHAIAEYVQTQVALRPLSRSGKYRVFFVREDGSIGEEMRYLPKGRKVFVHVPSGQPVLMGECGNPLTAMLPGLAPQQVQNEPSVVTVQRENLTPVEDSTSALAVEPPVVRTVDLLLPDPSTLPEPVETTTLALWEGEPVLSMEGLELDINAGSRDDGLVLVPLLLVALFGALESSHSIPPPYVIPEPTSIASLAAGMALLAAWERRRRRSSHPSL